MCKLDCNGYRGDDVIHLRRTVLQSICYYVFSGFKKNKRKLFHLTDLVYIVIYLTKTNFTTFSTINETDMFSRSIILDFLTKLTFIYLIFYQLFHIVEMALSFKQLQSLVNPLVCRFFVIQPYNFDDTIFRNTYFPFTFFPTSIYEQNVVLIFVVQT